MRSSKLLHSGIPQPPQNFQGHVGDRGKITQASSGVLGSPSTLQKASVETANNTPQESSVRIAPSVSAHGIQEKSSEEMVSANKNPEISSRVSINKMPKKSSVEMASPNKIAGQSSTEIEATLKLESRSSNQSGNQPGVPLINEKFRKRSKMASSLYFTTQEHMLNIERLNEKARRVSVSTENNLKSFTTILEVLYSV